jgi:hypothetical protein
LDRVRAAPIYVGLFGGTYSAPTAHEYLTVVENPYREILTYVKRSARVDHELTILIQQFDDPREGHTTRHFDTWGELKPHFEQHLWSAVGRMITHYLQLAAAPPTPRGESSVMLGRWQRQQRHLRELGLPEAGSRLEAETWADALRHSMRIA